MPTRPATHPARPRPHPALPAVVTSFVGRGREVGEVCQLLASARLLSLLGPGGAGKTRLALAAAAEAEYQFVDGACWVGLAQVGDPAFVPRALAKALEVAEQPEVPLAQTLLEKLGGKSLLLILDNCEHLLAACAGLAGLLLSAPGLRILTTSREPLGLEGEVRYAVPPLSLPKLGQPLTALSQSEAVRLFVERAQNLRPEFALTPENAPLVADLCRRLDGLPLAIELASARVGVLSLRQLRERLEGRLDVLRSSTAPDARHQTLRSAMDWSYQLLPYPERLLLQRLSLFASGFGLGTVEAVCAWGELGPSDILELLTSLVNKSLVAVDSLDGDEARYRLLETIKQYASEKLETSGARAQAHDRYLDGFSRLVEEIAPKLHQPDQQRWLIWLVREQDNLRVALEWAHRQHRYEAGLRLVTALYHFWEFHGHSREGLTWFERLLEVPEGEAARLPLALHVSALTNASLLATFVYDRTLSRAWAEKAVALCEASGGEGQPLLGLALSGLVWATATSGDPQTALGLWPRIRELERASGRGSSRTVLMGYWSVGMIEASTGDLETSLSHLSQALQMAEAANDPHTTGRIHTSLGDVARLQGRFADAVACYDSSLSSFRRSGTPGNLATTQRRLAYACLRQKDTGRALALLAESLEAQVVRDNRSGILRGLLGCAALGAAVGLWKASACLQGCVERNRTAIQGHQAPGDLADARDDQHYAALVRSRLSEMELEAAQAKGRAMTLDQAVAYALGLDLQAAKPSHDLTRRERDLVSLIGGGLSNGDIAHRLGLSKRTVEKHIANILVKLEFKNRAQIVRWAVEGGLGGGPGSTA